MTTYYIRQSGSDSNAGTSAGAAWRTLGKAIGASGMSSGDTVWIGPGVYKEYFATVSMTSPVAETFIKGDITGANTGDPPGEVILCDIDQGFPGRGGAAIDLNGRDYLTFQDLSIFGRQQAVYADTTLSTNITFTRCYLQGHALDAFTVTGTFSNALNWTLDHCIIFGGTDAFIIIGPTGVGADYDLNVQFTDCVLIGGNTRSAYMSHSGASANKPGGVDFTRCTFIGLFEIGANFSTSVPCTIQDSIVFGKLTIAASQLTDGGNNLFTGTTTNLTKASSSRNSTNTYNLAVNMGQHALWNLPSKPLFSPMLPGWNTGIGSSPTTDLFGRTPSDGGGDYWDSGTATAGAATTLTDSGKAWVTNEHQGRLVRITGGTGSGQIKHIASNTATVLTIGTKSGDWSTTPSTDSTYIIYDSTPAETGKATSGSTTTIVDSGAAWTTNQWAGYTAEITAGTGIGESKVIASNTGTTLTTATFVATIDNTSVYSIYKGALTTQGKFPGAVQRHDTAEKQTTVLNGGSTGYELNGYASQDFYVPVSAGTTTITVPVRYDTNHGTTNKPQVSVLADGLTGISASTSTMTAGANTWESVAVSVTATAAGFALIRVQSRSDVPYGRVFIDGGAWRFGRAYGQIARPFQLRPVV